MVKLLLFGLVSSVLLSTAATAQPVVFIYPPNPTTIDEIALSIGMLGCGQHIVATRLLGQSIEIDVAGSHPICVLPPPQTITLRLLVPGTYTVRVMYDGIVIGPATTFEVTLAPEHIPAVDQQILFGLACALVIIGTAMLNRHS